MIQGEGGADDVKIFGCFAIINKIAHMIGQDAAQVKKHAEFIWEMV